MGACCCVWIVYHIHQVSPACAPSGKWFLWFMRICPPGGLDQFSCFARLTSVPNVCRLQFVVLMTNKWRVKRCIKTCTHPFNCPLSGTTQVSQYQKVKPVWISLKQQTVNGSGISWAICKSAPRSRQITTPAPHHSVFYRPDALPATQPTASKHGMQCIIIITIIECVRSL